MLDLSEKILATLPAASRLKLERHAADRAAAYAAYRHASDAEQEARRDYSLAVATLRQRQEMPQGFNFNSPQRPNPDTEARLAAPVEAAERVLKAATAARERAAEKQSTYGFLSDVEDWLRRTANPSIAFEAAKPDPAIIKTKDPLVALAKIRDEISTLNEKFADVDRAPAPAADLKERALAEIDAIATEGCPTIYTTTRGSSPINLKRRLSIAARYTGGEANAVSIVGDGGAPFFVWLMQDEIKKKIGDLIDAKPLENAMTDDEREQAFRSIAARRLELELQEEALTEVMENEGRTVVRRDDIDPRAYLMIDA